MQSAEQMRRPWTQGLLCAALLAVGLRCFVAYGAPYLWFPWNPGRAIGYWLLGTPLASIAPDVRFFVTGYLPDCGVLFLGGVAVGKWSGRKWAPISTVLLLVYMGLHHLQGGSPVAYALQAWNGQQIHGVVRYAVFTAIICMSALLGGWLGVRYLAKKPPREGYCSCCQYDLTGLPERRCPECGREF